MKSIFLTSFFTVVYSLSVQAQQDFEGMIRYKVSPEKIIYIKDITDDNDSMEINIWFTKGKIMIRNISKKPAEDILVLIDSGKVYTIDRYEKTYRVKKLRIRKPTTPPSVIQIAGYRSSPVQINGSGHIFGGIENTIIWFADSLFFTVPEKYEDNEDLLMVRNGHIMLKAEISNDFTPDYNGEAEQNAGAEVNDNKITIVASAVIPGNIRLDDFMVPADYTLGFPNVMADTVSLSDTAFIPDPPSPAPKKAPAAPKKPATKGTATTKPPIRKEN